MNHSWFAIFLLLVVLPTHTADENPAASASAPEVDMNRPLIRLKFKVHVLNGFSSNKKPLIIHCYSRDDDLGEHTLWMKGEFKFHFSVGFFHRSHFWCDMQWGSKKKRVDVFRMEVEYSDCIQTGNCFWRATERGIFFSNDNRNWVKKYFWPIDV